MSGSAPCSPSGNSGEPAEKSRCVSRKRIEARRFGTRRRDAEIRGGTGSTAAAARVRGFPGDDQHRTPSLDLVVKGLIDPEQCLRIATAIGEKRLAALVGPAVPHSLPPQPPDTGLGQRALR